MRILYPRSFLFAFFIFTPTLPHYVFSLFSSCWFLFSVWMEDGSRRLGTTKGGYHCLRCLMICIWIWSLKICLVFTVCSRSHLPCPHVPPSLFHLGHIRNDLAMYSITSYQWDKAERSRTREISKKKNDPQSRNNDHDPSWEEGVKLVRYP